jgi:hypothetical protein
MPIQLRLAAALTAAIIAAATQHQYLASRLETQQFISFRQPVKNGNEILAEHLQPAEIGSAKELDQLLIRWDDKIEVIGSRALRDYPAGELVTRRECEIYATRPVVPNSGEHLFTLELPSNIDVKSQFQIGDKVLFHISRKNSSHLADEAIEPCGPFDIRALGPITMNVPQRTLQAISGRQARLSVPIEPGKTVPDSVVRLLQAASGVKGTSIVSVSRP